ncbi:suppressor of fused domain protein [Corynebacterium cystitidis]|uniref:suppressor of fused domain protein n=1 Tax=Corynebacterium cystitidis TaxID=35757 RepID=UPI00211EE78F|nr:suppressor of fused domain protein [Corynebacterium cystitidis]
MTGEEIAVWLSNIFGELGLSDIEGRRLAFTTLDDDTRAAMTCGFSGVDTGLVLEAEQDTEVRAELVVVTRTAPDVELASALLAAWDELAGASGTLAAQPGTFLPDLVQRSHLAEVVEHKGAEPVTVRHGVLREPQLFEQGTPHFTEPGRMTLLLELVLLTDEEFELARERGIEGLDTRLRRRATDLGNWRRE